MGLLDNLKYNAQQLAKGLLNAPSSIGQMFTPEYAQKLSQALQTMPNDPLQVPLQSPMMQREMLNQGLNIAGIAPTLHTVYHGSPHLFDKFDMSKIGTGEGAQAYGHGLYFAESPAVANDYAGALSAARAAKPVGNVDLTQVYQNLPNDVPETLLAARRDFRALNDSGDLSSADRRDFLEAVKNNITAAKNGNLYKVDIPDEAIPRMLDWDRPLSEQPHVMKALLNGDTEYQQYASQLSPEMRQIADDMVIGKLPVHSDDISATWQPLLDNYPNLDHNAIHDVRYRMFPQQDDLDWLSGVLNGSSAPGSGVRGGGGADLYNSLGNSQDAAAQLKALGIPGIRYLDGNSRGAGQGSSNYVLFDDALARILERNGQPTGLQPWQPGEWPGLLK